MQAIQTSNQADDIFPVLVGDIEQDTSMLIGELSVGDVVTECGWARLFLVWQARSFLGAVTPDGEQLYPTLESYIQYVAEATGKSRQTIFNRLGTYRSLCEERHVPPRKVFSLSILSAGAARKLASADQDDDNVTLINESWEDTVEAASTLPSKAESLRFVRHDILHEPQISAEFDGDSVIVVTKESYPVDSDAILDNYYIALDGEWPEDMIKWIARRLNARIGM